MRVTKYSSQILHSRSNNLVGCLSIIKFFAIKTCMVRWCYTLTQIRLYYALNHIQLQIVIVLNRIICQSLKVDIFLSACGNSGDEVFLVKILLMPTQICLGLLKDWYHSILSFSCRLCSTVALSSHWCNLDSPTTESYHIDWDSYSNL